MEFLHGFLWVESSEVFFFFFNLLRNNLKDFDKVVLWTFHLYFSLGGWGTQKQYFISKTMFPWSWAEGLLITEFSSQILKGPPTGFLNLWALSSNNLFLSRLSLETKDLCHSLHILKWNWSWLKQKWKLKASLCSKSQCCLDKCLINMPYFEDTTNDFASAGVLALFGHFQKLSSLQAFVKMSGI